MRRLLRALDRFWFAEALATPLAVLRIVIGTYALVYLLRRFRLYSDIASSPPSLFEPVGLASLLSAPVPPRLFEVILVLTLLANVAFILGWRFRRTGPLFAGLLLWVLCYRNSWSMIYHTDNLLVLHVLILGLTRSADTLALDALEGRSAVDVFRRLRRFEPIFAARRHWEYGYPMRLIGAVTAVTYVLAGVAKVTGPLGWWWGSGEGLRIQVAFDGLRKELLEDGAGPLAFLVYNNVPLSTAMASGSLVLELGAPLALLSPRLGYLWVAGVFTMHWGILAVMGIQFWYQMSGVAFASFVVSEDLIAWWRARIAAIVSWIGSPGGIPGGRQGPYALGEAVGADRGDAATRSPLGAT